MKKSQIFKYDFAISYAGEDIKIAEGIKQAIIESHGNYNVFLAADEQEMLIGKDGEKFFEELFKSSKQIIVLFSENYKKKRWTRFEYDIIDQQDDRDRFFPVKIDDVNILGLPSNIIYFPFNNNFFDVASIAIKKLVKYEKKQDIYRETPFKLAKRKIENSKGAVDKSIQLIRDKRQRTPLENIEFPQGDYNIKYSIIEERDLPYSVFNRKEIIINVPPNLSKDEIIYNIKYCNTVYFNKFKPEAIAITVFSNHASNFLGFNEKYNVAYSIFALYGDWGKAEEGFAYNMPASKFDYNIIFEDSYFKKNLKMITNSDIVEQTVYDLFEEKIYEFISNSSKVKTRDIYKNIKIKNEIINKLLKKLQKENRIIKNGPTHDWYWEIAYND
ncbi:TIR domain protein [anaerobic digester metagenome]